MLTIFRRHLKVCPHRSRSYRRCRCPIHCHGSLGGVKIRRSLDLISWEAAQEKIHLWESQGSFEGGSDAIPTEQAVESFMAYCRTRNLSPATIDKYRTTLAKRLLLFCRDQGIVYVHTLNLHNLQSFHGGWANSPATAHKRIEQLRTFFSFCLDHHWVTENIAKGIKLPRIEDAPTMPFTADEVDRILKACDHYPVRNTYGRDNRVRIRTLVLMLLYSGLRIRDIVTLKKSKVSAGQLFLYTQKTRVPVRLPLPPVVIDALQQLCNVGDYFFWSGQGKPKSAVGDWQRSLKTLFEIAGIDHGHAHRFRDTFAVRLLEHGVPLESVSILLGHRSIRITEKHYAPWVKSRQDQLEKIVREAWVPTQPPD